MNAKKCKALRGEATNIQEYLGQSISKVAAYTAYYHKKTIPTPIINEKGEITGTEDKEYRSTQILLHRDCWRYTYKALKMDA